MKSPRTVRTPGTATSRRITCNLCWNEKEVKDFSDYLLTPACSRDCTTCRDCLSSSITADLDNKGPRNIACPTCDEPIPYENVLRHGDTRLKERYESALLRHSLQEDNAFIWCSWPGCDGGQIHVGGTDQPIVKCNNCGRSTCFIHRCPWHKDVTCDEYDKIQPILGDDVKDKHALLRHVVDNRASEETVEKTTKPCPKCGSKIEKDGGW
ncbi:ring finger protein [Grosmannia clavigera kw1407]|uniref:RBR-type E3 ubiquitin transferase n=1 Tax=Grosmannia clavigera (strain kw1407 / UAMH 11150) TaxID=655863 RepID=F0X8E4_GROCL|nr:ring finger protein [Grosmannia clavigera kw1407]EFX05666.1 ring finger protein [Grosmannia clavigera kw1407]